VAFLGPEGTFTQQAAYKHFGHSIQAVPRMAIDEIFRTVECGDCQFGVVPVENSTEGVITHTLDCFVGSPLLICGEVTLPIHHNLLSLETDIARVREVFSHQQSLAQCRRWLDRHMPGAARTAVASNAEAARLAAETSCSAAIAGEMAAELYDLRVLDRHIEDEADNTTRFLVVGRQASGASGQDKTSLLVSTDNKPGVLYRILAPFATHGISLSKIESRPSHQGIWEYIFFIDVEGHRDDPPLAIALQELQEQARFLKILGSYPRAAL
jgi:chorismate mutase/prephenate dehydratase